MCIRVSDDHSCYGSPLPIQCENIRGNKFIPLCCRHKCYACYTEMRMMLPKWLCYSMHRYSSGRIAAETYQKKHMELRFNTVRYVLLNRIMIYWNNCLFYVIWQADISINADLSLPVEHQKYTQVKFQLRYSNRHENARKNVIYKVSVILLKRLCNNAQTSWFCLYFYADQTYNI